MLSIKFERPPFTTAVLGLLALALLAVPLCAAGLDNAYLLTLCTRVLVFALAATALNVALGFGGMVSLGHAMYLGLGAYVLPLAQGAGIMSGWLQLLVLMVAVVALAVPVGWVALRTQGIAFIMITLAFSQLCFFVAGSLRAYGGDEGMTLQQGSGFGALTGNRHALYYALLASVFAALYASHRLSRSRFGLVLRASHSHARRVAAVGTQVLPYRLTAYVLSALGCALAGFFLANLNGFVSPAYLAWTVSGELIAMVVLGGVGSVVGPALGAAALMLVEELLRGWTEYWMMILGPLLMLMVLCLRRGLWELLAGAAAREQA
nr:branched-chain amino acid ABC transporter permease [uncultured Roseateles sp.]